jgi:hypothetical protein
VRASSSKSRLVAQAELQLSLLLLEIDHERSRRELSRKREEALAALVQDCRRIISAAASPSGDDLEGLSGRVTFRSAVLRVLDESRQPLTAAVLRERVEMIAGPALAGTISVTLARLRADRKVELTDRRQWKLASKQIEDQ